MKILIGQGNNEPRYAGTRHNIGFMALDTFAAQEGSGVAFLYKSKFQAEIAELTIAGEKVLLVKPTTFYNETGRAARLLADFYHVAAEDILVIHDELALPFGHIRIRNQGSDGGNNGIKSINRTLGEHFWRIRIGIQNAYTSRTDKAVFVLSQFTKDERAALQNAILPAVSEEIEHFVRGEARTTTLSV